jgi:hypothetical protein
MSARLPNKCPAPRRGERGRIPSRPVAFCFAWNLTIPFVRVATFGDFVYEPLGAFIMGGTTFASLADYWPTKTGAEEPLAECMNSIEKLVCSRTIETTGWSNPRVLAGDIGESIGRLRRQPGKDFMKREYRAPLCRAQTDR